MLRPKNCKKCGGRMKQTGGLQPYTQSNTPAGATTPTGQSSLASNSQLTPEQVYGLANQFGFRTDNNKNLQEDLFNYAQTQQPTAYNQVMQKYGQTSSGSFIDGLLGARTSDLLSMLTPPQKSVPADMPARANLTEHLYGPDKHALGMASQKYRDSKSVTDPGLPGFGDNPDYVDFQYYLPESANIDESRGRYKIPYSVWANQITRGTTTVQDPSLIQQYLVTPNNTASTGMKMKGGRIMRQNGGMIDLSLFMPKPLTEQDIIPGVNAPYPEEQDMTPQYQDRIQEGIAKGIIEPPKDWEGTPMEWYNFMQQPQKKNNKTPQNTLRNIGIAMKGIRTGLGEVAGRVERGRQNQYDYLQQTALGQLNPMPLTDYQPNPYSMYAKYGGSLKNYMKYGGLQNVKYFGPPFSNGASFKFSPSDKIDSKAVRRISSAMLRGWAQFKKGGIHIKPENKGKFTDYCGGKVTSDCIQKGLHSPSATIRKRANFARNARKWNH